MAKPKENKYLFICMANINRSRLGEEIFKKMLEQAGFRVGSLEDEAKEGFHFIVDSAGILKKHGKRTFKKSMAKGARYIFAADRLIVRYLREDFGFGEDGRIIDLEIPDRCIDYDWERKDLEELLLYKLREYIPVR